MPAVVVLRAYLEGLRAIQLTGEAVAETSYYGQLERLLNEVGRTLSPRVTCVLTTKNRGAGVPDGGLFIARQAVAEEGESALLARAPERGVMEVKGPAQDVLRVARSAQVRRYLRRYGKVLVSTYRDFLVVRLDAGGEVLAGERFTLAPDEGSFWSLRPGDAENTRGAEFADYLKRALLGDAPLTAPADLAWFLAAYARTALKRVESAGDMQALAGLRNALEEALGLRFEGEDGEHFFRSTLVQTLFYGVFASWVFWAAQQPEKAAGRFTWRQAQWTLSVPMVRVLFQQLATPANLPVGLDEVLDWTDDVLARVDREQFFQRFEAAEAVQYFYEPFLQAYDPELRRELGVWYTPPEIVRYMVARVHQALQRDLGLKLGLADDSVHLLDPCTGTGSFLVESINTISRVLQEEHGDALVAQDVKAAALSRVHGFELLPAPFVIAHLNVGLALDRLGAPLSAAGKERAQVYLTNALTGWVDGHEHPRLPFPEFEAEREAAEDVKQATPILVVIGNPPYNGFAGVSGREEGSLVEPYKQGLAENWDITKNKLDDLYIRFFRVAERRIAEQTGKGIVCFISNFSWLGDPSAVVMREHLIRNFDSVYIDNLNGDSRETGKKTPAGLPDPSVFSTRLNPPGIQVGTAVSLLIRQRPHDAHAFTGSYRDFWGADKRANLEASLVNPAAAPDYEPLLPAEKNWYRLRRWAPRQGYDKWPSIPDLAATDPVLGLNENRQFALIDSDRDALTDRIKTYLDPDIPMAQVDPRLSRAYARFDPKVVREQMLDQHPFDEHHIQRFLFRPLDMRYAYVETGVKLWNESRPHLVAAAAAASGFLLVRRRAPRALDGAAFLLSRELIDQHVMHKDAYVIPFWLAAEDAQRDDGQGQLFAPEDQSDASLPWRPNLSARALAYLAGLGINDAATSQDSARLLWLHVLAVGYSPLYLEENGDAIRNDWPRVPLPADLDRLASSADLGRYIANLLDLDLDVDDVTAGVDAGVSGYQRTVARIERIDGRPLATDDSDLALTAGWAIEQRRTQRSGAVSRIVMPGAGRVEIRERTETERQPLADEHLNILGARVVDVYLNDRARWCGVPEAVWDLKIGGFQVLRKWLSYREKPILGRDLTTTEARTFTAIARRLTALALLGPSLDANYLRVADPR